MLQTLPNQKMAKVQGHTQNSTGAPIADMEKHGALVGRLMQIW